MDIRQLKTFKMIAELRSFSRAAQRLDFAPSTVTAHIKTMEEDLGTPLFDRLGKKIYLTESGNRLLPYANNIISLYDQSKEVIMNPDIAFGSLTIGTTESLTVYQLPLIIGEFKRKHPNVNLSFKTTDGKKLRNYLQNGEIDIALLFEIEKKEESEFTIRKLGSEPMVLIEPHPYNAASQKNTVLFTGEGCDYRFLFERYLKEKKIHIDTIYELGSIEAIKQFVANGLGISLLPLMSVKEEIKKNQFKVTPWETDNHKIEVFLAQHKDKWVSPIMQSFVDVASLNFK